MFLKHPLRNVTVLINRCFLFLQVLCNVHMHAASFLVPLPYFWWTVFWTVEWYEGVKVSPPINLKFTRNVQWLGLWNKIKSCSQSSHFIRPEIIWKTKIFLCFPGVWNRNIDQKWVKWTYSLLQNMLLVPILVGHEKCSPGIIGSFL